MTFKVAQNVVVSEIDCGTVNGLSKSALYKGDELEVPLRISIRGRIARDTIVDPVTDKVIVAENEIITEDIARQCRGAGIGCVSCKKLLAEGINTALAPFRERRAELSAQPQYIADVLADGAERARAIARETMREVRQNMGLTVR